MAQEPNISAPWRVPRKPARLLRDEAGAVTTDWVVLTSGAVGLALAVTVQVFGGVISASDTTASLIQTAGDDPVTQPNATLAQSYFDFGIASSPDDQRQAWLDARLQVHSDAPSGYNYDPDRNETRYVDIASGLPIYESSDGTTYSIGGDIIAANDYDNSGRQSFKSTFDDYWNQNQ